MAERTNRVQPEWGRKLSSCCIIRQRVVLELMGLLAIVLCFMTRVCLSHAITVLVIKYSEEPKNVTFAYIKDYCPRDDNFNVPIGTYDWSELLQGFILASFFVGYCITQLPGVLLTNWFGGKWILVTGMLFSGLSSALSPLTIESFGPYVFIALRIIMGLGQGLAFPSLSGILANWVPINERGTLGAFIICGGIFGSFAGNLLSGILLDKYHWSVVFKVFGTLTLIWCFFFILLCFSSPVAHPYITKNELDYLREELRDSGRKEQSPVPWSDILTCGPIWALVIVQFGHDWGVSLIINDLPKYFSHIQGIGVLDNGVYTSLPFLPFAITAIIFGYIGDCLILREYLSVTTVRKLMTVIACWCSGVLMVAASYAFCDRRQVIALFVVCLACMGPYFTGIKLVPMDMSPNHAVAIAAVTHSFGAIGAFLAPIITGLMVTNNILLNWRLCFWLAFGILFFSAIVFLLWGSADLQPYDDPDYKKKRDQAKPLPNEYPIN